mgnify:CR=1 FL=1
MKEHDAIIRLLKTSNYIDRQLNELHDRSVDVKLLTNTFQQLKLLKQLEATYGLTIYNLSDKAEDKKLEMDDKLFALLKKSFNITRRKPATYQGYKQLYVSLVKSATSKSLIQSKKSSRKEDRDVYHYFLDTGLIKTHLELNQFKNKACKGFCEDAIAKFDIKQPEVEDEDTFVDNEVVHDLGSALDYGLV